MNYIDVANGRIRIPEIGLGCMRMVNMPLKEAEKFIQTALEEEINFFDHADVYGGGKAEEIFAQAIGMSAGVREKIILQSKCGIRDGFFDFSKDHILASVEGILKRLKTDYLDVLLLHRPDALMEADQVAEAFNRLYESGKVRHFGVSNQNPMQIELLKKSVEQPLIFNQLQLSIMRTGMIDSGVNVNMKVPSSIDHDGHVLDYCRLNNITLQAWSPFQYGFFEGVFLDNAKFPELNQVIDRIAETYSVSNSAIAVAWILRHPAKIQTLVGTMNMDRLKSIAAASRVQLSRQEWYEIYTAAGNKLP